MKEEVRQRAATSYRQVGNTVLKPEQKVYENPKVEVKKELKPSFKRERTLSLRATVLTVTVVAAIAVIMLSAKYFNESNVAINSQTNGYIEQIEELDKKIGSLQSQIDAKAPSPELIDEYISQNGLIKVVD